MPPPPTAGPPSGLADTATAVALPEARISALRSSPILTLPPTRAVELPSATPVSAASMSLSMSLRLKATPTEKEVDPPLKDAAMDTALADTSEPIKVRPSASIVRSPPATSDGVPVMVARVCIATLFIAATGATVMEVAASLPGSTLKDRAEFSIVASILPIAPAVTEMSPAAVMREPSIEAIVANGCLPA